MIVGYNEGSLLRQCINSIDFCDEILYADLGSSDKSVDTAKLAGAKVYHREKVPSGEYIQSEIVHYTKHDWVIFIDPDELVDENLKDQLIKEFEKIKTNELIGGVSVPWHFYFRKHKLKGTIWGGNNQKHFLVNKDRYEFLPITHYGRKIKDGFYIQDIVLNEYGNNFLHHYWMNGYKVFIKKHQRYLKNEGKDEFDRGRRTSIKKILLAPFKEFYFSLITKKGYKDNFIGLFLSVFWAYYKTVVYIGVYKVQKKNMK
jgi:GT2 family glycosyltransferase